MPPAKKAEAQPKVAPQPSTEVVLVSFAYAAAKDGEVVQLVKGNPVDPDRYKGASLDHLRSLGFIGSQD
jgi:hypothetical protein